METAATALVLTGATRLVPDGVRACEVAATAPAAADWNRLLEFMWPPERDDRPRQPPELKRPKAH
ncbi:MAG: hypothetical protein EPO27_11875 [Betaproteobacteria bacterium]|nr:MAG: hypothetical protein EPO27_11875 [Betaproteobacteria bacterium]